MSSCTMEQQNKSRRKASDARWRAGIASCFEILRNIIPNGHLHPKRKISKALVLRETGNHISFLEKVIAMLLTEISNSEESSCSSLKDLSMEKVKEQFLYRLTTGEPMTMTSPTQEAVNKLKQHSTSNIPKDTRNTSRKNTKHTRLNPRLSRLQTNLDLAVCVRETEIREAVHGSGPGGIQSIRKRKVEEMEDTENLETGSWWIECSEPPSGNSVIPAKSGVESFEESSTPLKRDTSTLDPTTSLALSPIEPHFPMENDYGIPPPTPGTPVEGGIFSFNFNEVFATSPSNLTPIKLLPSARGAPATPGSGSETESAADTPAFKFGDTSQPEDEGERSLLCEERFENIDFGDEIDSPLPLRPTTPTGTRRRSVTPPFATPPSKLSMDMMDNRRPPPKCRRKLEESFPEPTEQENQEKLSDGNDFDGFLMFYKQLVGQLENYLTQEEITSKATFSMISKMWKALPADQKTTVITMAMMDDFLTANESLDDDLKDLAVVPIEHSPVKLEPVPNFDEMNELYARVIQEVLCSSHVTSQQVPIPLPQILPTGYSGHIAFKLMRKYFVTVPNFDEMNELYARVIQEVLCSSHVTSQQVPNIPLPQIPEREDMIFEVPSCDLQFECQVSPEDQNKLCRLIGESGESQASNSSGSFVPSHDFTNLKMDSALNSLDNATRTDRDLLTVDGLYRNHTPGSGMWNNLPDLENMMECD